MLARPEEAEAKVEPNVSRLDRKFSELVETCTKFSREISREAGFSTESLLPGESVTMNLEIARTIFGKWSVDILALLYGREEAGFQEIRRGLGAISSRVLSSKLARMQECGLVHRDVKPTRPPRVAYSLTERGLMVAKLGEPVFLFLRLEERPPVAPRSA